MKTFVGYGIVDKDNDFCWDEDRCFFSEKESADDYVEEMNIDCQIGGKDEISGYEPPAPYRVVKLYWEDET